MSINTLNDLLEDLSVLKNKKEELAKWKQHTKAVIKKIKDNPLYGSHFTLEEKESLKKLESIVESIYIDEVNI